MPGGDRGLVSWPARSAEFRDNIPVVAAIGERLGCTAFNALYGNRVDGASAAEQDDLAAENLTLAAQGVPHRRHRAGGAGQRLPALPAADRRRRGRRHRPGTADGGPTNIGLLADLYHLAVNGDDVDKAIAAYTGTPGGIAHVQIADAPGRGAPGHRRASARPPARRPGGRRLPRLGRPGVQGPGRQPRHHSQFRLAAARAPRPRPPSARLTPGIHPPASRTRSSA